MKIQRLTAVVSMFASAAFAQTAPQRTIVLNADRMITISSPTLVRNARVVVTGDRITAVGTAANVQVPAGAQVIDLGDVTLLPGFIDAHTHIAGRTLGDPHGDVASVKDYQGYAAILGVENAQRTLMGGFTSIRVLGSGDFDDLALRQAIEEGRAVGPRIQGAGHALGITGGHCDENGWKPGLLTRGPEEGIANGPEEVRKAVRYQVKYGADVIKTCATGGVLSEGDAVGATQYTYEEMKAMVDEATKLERKVAAHAHGTEGIKIATRAGVASIEHGSFLDDEGARLMKEHGTYLVPTLMAGMAAESFAKNGVLKGLRAEKALAAAAAMRKGVHIAHQRGVKIALGTDAGVIPHGTNAREFGLMVEWGGLTPIESLTAGTMNGAKLLGWDKRVGSLENGKLADIVAIPGNPLEDIHRTENVTFVMKGGVIYKGQGAR
ncbi:MAG TPA: amidohydrolase family protein [Gemmatimonadaceae bacterium]|nr:amidohydrolase family protein [Gemmatimonadaceae bacterium]